RGCPIGRLSYRVQAGKTREAACARRVPLLSGRYRLAGDELIPISVVGERWTAPSSARPSIKSSGPHPFPAGIPKRLLHDHGCSALPKNLDLEILGRLRQSGRDVAHGDGFSDAVSV